MDDKHKTKALLISELEELRRRIARTDNAELPQPNCHPPFLKWADNAASAIFVFKDAEFRYTNAATSRITGYAPEELIGRNVWSLVHPEFRESIRERVAAWRRGDSVPDRSEFKILTKSGATRWINADSTFIEFDGEPAALTIAFDSTDHKLAEEALNESEERYRNMVETAQEGIWIVDRKAKTTYANRRLAEMFGYTRDEMMGRSVFDFVDETAHQETRSLLERVRRGIKWRHDFQFLRRDGSDLWAMVSTTPLFDGEGRFAGGLAMLVDVTERHWAEAALRESEERHRDLVENARDIIYSHDLIGNYTSVNKAVEQITGYSREEALKLTFEQAVAPEYIETARQMIAAKLAGQKETVYDLEIIAKDGRRMMVEVNTRLVLQDDVPVGIQGIARDVTARKRAEEALRRSEERFRRYFELGLIGMAIASPGAGFIEVNDKMCELLGYERTELLQLSWAQLAHPADRVHLERILDAESDGCSMDARFIRKDGGVIHATISVSWVRRADRSSDYSIALLQDVTQRRQAERALRESRSHLQAILDNCPAMIFQKDLDGRYLQVNRQFEYTFDLPPEQVLGRTDDELFPPELARAFRASDRSVLEAGRSLEFEQSAAYAGALHTYIIHKFPLLDAAGNTYAVGGISTDITEHKRAADLLRRKSAHLAALHEIELEIGAESDLSRILEVVTRRAAELLDAAHCSTYIRDRGDASLTLVASVENRFIGLRLEGNEGLAGRALITGESQRVDDYSEWRGRATAFDTESFGPSIAAPLKWQQTVTGAISLSRKHGEERFTPEDSRLLEQLAAEAAIAIHQATLFDEVQENQNRLQILSRRLIDAQEDERKRLSRELHDQIGQALTAVQINLHALQTSSSGACVGALDDCLAIIDTALRQVHDLSLDLRPSLLDDLGLVAALRWYVDRVGSRAGLVRCFNADVFETRLAPPIETACFRIAQEALTNVMRHAHAATVRVKVTQQDSSLQLVVQDDGVGFDVRAAMSRTGVNASLGLQGMQERAASLGGVVKISSNQGSGVEVQVSFPLAQAHSV